MNGQNACTAPASPQAEREGLNSPEDAGLPHDHPIRRLRRLAAGNATAADAAWLADGVAEYEAGAPDGLELGRALGLTVGRGGAASTWWAREARHRRDQAIRQTANAFFGNLGVAEAADEIRKAARRCTWLRTLTANTAEAAIAEANRFMSIPQTAEEIEKILRLK